MRFAQCSRSLAGSRCETSPCRTSAAALAKMAVTDSTPTMQKAHNCLTRALRHAEGRDLVPPERLGAGRHPARPGGPPLAGPDPGAGGGAAGGGGSEREDSRLHAYHRAAPADRRPVRGGAGADVGPCGPRRPARSRCWRSVRAHGDTKTNRSRRTLRIPQIAVEALQGQLRRQAAERSTAGELWQEHGLVFTTPWARRTSRTTCAGTSARSPQRPGWAPGGSRRNCGPVVSRMSYQGVPVEEIAGLAGHASSRTTEVVYRRELRPVITTGAESHGPDLPAETARRSPRGSSAR